MATTDLQITEAFQAVYNALDLKEQRKALKGATRKEANTIKKAAQQNAIASKLGKGSNNAQVIAKGIYARTYPDRYGSGFMVTVKPHGKKGYHTNRQGLEKPILMWAETGTGVRHVGKRKGSYKKWSSIMSRATKRYNRSGHSTGAMPQYKFMEKTERENTDGVEIRLFDNFQKNIEKAARKEGLL